VRKCALAPQHQKVRSAARTTRVCRSNAAARKARGSRSSESARYTRRNLDHESMVPEGPRSGNGPIGPRVNSKFKSNYAHIIVRISTRYARGQIRPTHWTFPCHITVRDSARESIGHHSAARSFWHHASYFIISFLTY